MAQIKGFRVNGFWRNDKVKFSGYFIAEDAEIQDVLPEEADDLIFYYGMSKQDIIDNKLNRNTHEDFKITQWCEDTIEISDEILAKIQGVKLYKKIEDAINLLAENGIAVEDLWSKNDVDIDYFSDEIKLKIVNSALKNDATKEQIRFAIDFKIDLIKEEVQKIVPIQNIKNKFIKKLLNDMDIDLLRDEIEFMPHKKSPSVVFNTTAKIVQHCYFSDEKEYNHDKNLIESYIKAIQEYK